MCSITADTERGVRPRDWNTTLIAEVEKNTGTSKDDPFGMVNLTAIRFSWLLDRGAIQEAGEQIDQCMEAAKHLPDQTVSSLMLSAAWYEARFRDNPIKARQILQRAKPNLWELEHVRPHIEAAILYREARFAEALKKAEEALAWTSGSPWSAEGAVDTEEIEKLMAEIRLAAASPSMVQ